MTGFGNGQRLPEHQLELAGGETRPTGSRFCASSEANMRRCGCCPQSRRQGNGPRRGSRGEQGRENGLYFGARPRQTSPPQSRNWRRAGRPRVPRCEPALLSRRAWIQVPRRHSGPEAAVRTRVPRRRRSGSLLGRASGSLATLDRADREFPPERAAIPGDRRLAGRNDQDRRWVTAGGPRACSAGPDVPPQSSGRTSAMDCEKHQ
jgi:hypothetical protein